MPFTFAHPIYAIPLKYISPKYYNLTGLILGSMAPDFEYFLMLEPYSSIGHSIAGLFFQGIPMCLLIAVIFHFTVKESFVIHLPSIFNLNQRAYNIMGEWGLRSLRDWIFFMLSVVVGFISHITLDAFTHVHGYFVIRFSLLSEVLFFNLPLYKMLQHSLSVFGLLAIFVVIISRLYRSNPTIGGMPKVTRKQKKLFWLIAITISVATTCLKLWITTSNNVIGIVVVSPISGLCLGLVLTSLIARRTTRFQKIDQTDMRNDK
ncbi:hypothetical protein J2T13_005335 [Paenibacillus sp. DS2015]|uniref:DUF4184 family protein n=1 Tax=Paenibacillus sp. DS2015 TaxID=3373917 RepID=UPI003D246654